MISAKASIMISAASTMNDSSGMIHDSSGMIHDFRKGGVVDLPKALLVCQRKHLLHLLVAGYPTELDKDFAQLLCRELPSVAHVHGIEVGLEGQGACQARARFGAQVEWL